MSSMKLIDILEEDINNNYRKVELWADKVGFEIININTERKNLFISFCPILESIK